ncbi:MAG: transglycosylase SLT domain-containing protein [Deltaproteobacteria bacterium]|nr:transglycosylase SLT domain-containing protein [Deltaproteobacteria bacterium]
MEANKKDLNPPAIFFSFPLMPHKLIISVVIFVLLVIPVSVFAKKKENKHPKKQIENQQIQDSSIPEVNPALLGALKGQVNAADIRDAQRLFKAMAHIESRQFDAAYSLLKDSNDHSILIDYINYYRALSLTYLRKYKEALGYLDTVKTPVKKIDLEKFWLKMQLLSLTKQKQGLSEAIDGLKKQRRNDQWVTIKGDYFKGRAEQASGNKRAAMDYFTQILIQNPGTKYDQKILRLLEKEGIPQRQVLNTAQLNARAENLIKAGQPHEALKIWRALYADDRFFEERVAYGTFKYRDYKTAASLYEGLLRSGNHQLSEPEILKQIAQSYARHDQFEKAIDTYRSILKKYPQSSEASFANFKLGFIYFDAEQYKTAAQYFEKFLTKGAKWQRDSARWFRVWSFYLTGDHAFALAEIDARLKEPGTSKGDKITLTYWKARLFDKQGKKEEARALYNKVVQLDGLDYYGLLARQRLKHNKLVTGTLIAPDVLSEVPDGKTDHVFDQPDLAPLAGDINLIKAVLLNHIGLYNFAFDESQYAASLTSVADYNTAKAFEMAGNYNRGYTARKAAQSGQMSGADLDKGFRLSFPRAYEQFVEAYAARWGISANLAYAVMRQESTFKPEAISYAAAYGLMQIIPPTGDEIAQKINFSDFEVDRLNDPKVNLLFGTYYLSYLLNQLNNNIIFAIAGYNAGPDAVKRWMVKAANLEMDEFIELIPYEQTNKYVKKVLVNYLIYEKLYR